MCSVIRPWYSQIYAVLMAMSIKAKKKTILDRKKPKGGGRQDHSKYDDEFDDSHAIFYRIEEANAVR